MDREKRVTLQKDEMTDMSGDGGAARQKKTSSPWAAQRNKFLAHYMEFGYFKIQFSPLFFNQEHIKYCNFPYFILKSMYKKNL